MNLLSAVRFIRTAEAAGFNPEVLALIEGADKLKYEVRNGKAYVTPEGGKEQLLEAYADSNWPDLLDTLRASAAEKKEDTPPAAAVDAAIARNRAAASRSNPLVKRS